MRPGKYGAMRQSWYGSNPRDLLRQVMLDNPRASEKEIFDAFCEGLNNDHSYWGAITEYWFANNFRSCSVAQMGNNSVAFIEQRAERRDYRRREVAEAHELKEKIKTVLMDFVLSSGKQLRDATFGECRTEGGWLLEISKRGKANEIVGRKLTEADLKSLHKRALGMKSAA